MSYKLGLTVVVEVRVGTVGAHVVDFVILLFHEIIMPSTMHATVATETHATVLVGELKIIYVFADLANETHVQINSHGSTLNIKEWGIKTGEIPGLYLYRPGITTPGRYLRLQLDRHLPESKRC